MSLIDEVLVLLDDYKDIKLANAYRIVSERNKQIISSTLGRLIAKGWVYKTNNTIDASYNLTKSGKERLYAALDNIKYLDKNSDVNNWLIVIFSIPEKNRKSRDDFRKYLIENGFGRLQSSVWLSYWDKESQINEFIINNNIQKNITIFYSKKMSNKQNLDLVSKLHWDWKIINSLYKKFIIDSKNFIKNKKKDSFRAKVLVISYAKILLLDPKLPVSLRPKFSLTEEAYFAYIKIRPYCYKK